MSETPPRHVTLVDGSGFIFRAFHGLPMMTRPDGVPVNAVYGFTSMLMKLMQEQEAGHLAVIFDAGRTTFRSEIYPDYKAHRPEPPEELVPQFALIREAVRAFNVPCVELPGFEADDLIATYARLAREQGARVTIVSSDKDLMQLVGEGVEMFDPLKNRVIGPAEVFEKFAVAPDKVVDVQALAGDSTDNVPGVPGIGIKTAAQLITEYGDLESLLAAAAGIKQPKRRESLLAHADLARISRRLVELRRDVPVPEPLESFGLRAPDRDTLLAFVAAQGFRSIKSRIEQHLANGAAPAAAAPAAPAAPAPVKTEAPAAKAEAPAAKVEAPAAKAETLAAKAEAPAVKTEAPAAKVEAPAEGHVGKAETVGHVGKAETVGHVGKADEPVSVPADAARIILKAREDCWIRIRDASGAIVHSGILRKGTSFRVTQRPGQTLTAGNAAALEVFVDNHALPPLGAEGVVRKGLPLDADRLRKADVPAPVPAPAAQTPASAPAPAASGAAE